jgi:hypothetical protein
VKGVCVMASTGGMCTGIMCRGALYGQSGKAPSRRSARDRPSPTHVNNHQPPPTTHPSEMRYL